ncbi:hypothetical protein ACQ4M4_12410 [Leptolyngbya sp. AN02str]|uniref:pPIWI_RE_Z domain-containing protein n=1 Tax=Leptolyngbya sp. AN02str TaxID=3423363 RepID=UPI003D316159
MRRITAWQDRLKASIQSLPEKTQVRELLDAELGLFLLSQVADQEEPATGVWVLLTGYPHDAIFKNLSDSQKQAIAIARHLLVRYRRPYSWKELLKTYQAFPESVRGYDLSPDCTVYKRRQNFSEALDRFEIYEQTLSAEIPSINRSITWATAGDYECEVSGIRQTLHLPAEFVATPPRSHNLAGTPSRNPIQIPWHELSETAQWMDDQLTKIGKTPEWVNRFAGLRLKTFDVGDNLEVNDVLVIDGPTHIGGQLGVGKSNLMKISTCHQARGGKRIAIVVADVMQVFDLCNFFQALGLSVAPILGNSNRENHLERLLRAPKGQTPQEILDHYSNPAFDWVSTTCPLSALIQEMEVPFAPGEQPCRFLKPLNSKAEEKHACSLYSVCPYHHKDIALVDAQIWITTPGGLVYSRVPAQINSESLTYYELIHRCCDLVIIDEVDQVQKNLDTQFCPHETFYRPGGSAWFDQLFRTVQAELDRQERKPLRNQKISDWWAALQKADIAKDRIYRLAYPELSEWQERGEYFTDWMIFNRIAKDLTEDEQAADEFMLKHFQPFLNSDFQTDPWLRDLANEALDRDVNTDLQEWIRQQIPHLSQARIQQAAIKLEFALLVCTLQNKLNTVVTRWFDVQDDLNLGGDSKWFQSPPLDYSTLLPVFPMGNQLAFQYTKMLNEEMGSLRFFRCMGLGRWLITGFKDIFRADNLAAPHALLLSGTSWAPDSPTYHVDIPIESVLVSEAMDVPVEIHSKILPMRDLRTGAAISVSGTGAKKENNLKTIVRRLIEDEYLEDAFDLIGTRKIVLYVPSYEQGVWAADVVNESEYADRAVLLVRDDSGQSNLGKILRLPRGQVEQFATFLDRDILIAPISAMERGHNITDSQGNAAIGAIFMLVFPHPVPDDFSHPVHLMCRWAMDHYKTISADTVVNIGQEFSDRAFSEWLSLLRQPIILRQLSPKALAQQAWDIAIQQWQAMSRATRNCNPAWIYWCDAKFTEENPVQLLELITQSLSFYFDPASKATKRDRQIAQALYEPFYLALKNTSRL